MIVAFSKIVWDRSGIVWKQPNQLARKLTYCYTTYDELLPLSTNISRGKDMDLSPSTHANNRLRQERIQQNWRQQDVADHLGATVITVKRWESGSQHPSAYFRVKLCALFGKSAEQLGLCSDMPELIHTLASDSLSARDLHESPEVAPGRSSLESSHRTDSPWDAGERLIDPLLPGCQDLIGREAAFARLKEQLCLGQGGVLAALGGLPGIGKTALALRLAHDPALQASFPDGILWAGLGPTPNVAGILSRWSSLLGITASSLPSGNDLDGWAVLLRMAIGKRRLLFVLDDAWHLADALAYRVGGPTCSYLLTTRLADVAFAWAGEQALIVHELTEEQSMQLFAAHAPTAVRTEPGGVQRVAQAVGGLPLAILLLGKYLELQTYSQQPRRLSHALEQLASAKQRYQVALPQAPFDRPAYLSACTPLSLSTALRISEQQLDHEARRTLHALSLFEARPATFSEEAALAVSATSVEHLDRLMDSGLLESHRPGRYMLHQVVRDYARLSNPDPGEAQGRLVAFFVALIKIPPESNVLEWELSQILVAFEMAFEQQWWEQLLQGVLAFMPFLEGKRLYSCVDVWLPRAHQAAVALADQEGMAWVWVWTGKMAELRGEHLQAEHAYLTGLEGAQQLTHPFSEGYVLILLGGVLLERGKYQRAKHHLEKGLRMVQSQHDDSSVILAHKNLGEVAASQGDSQQADQFFLQGLVLARRSEHWEMASALLQNLGAMAERRGEYRKAATWYDQGLTYAQQCQSVQRQSAILMNQGMLAFHEKQYTRALALSEESLRLARMIGNRMRMSSVLQNVGMIERVLGHLAHAENYLQESLELAQGIGNRWLISEIEGEWGALYVQQQQFKRAKAAFHRMLQEAEALDAPFLMEQARSGLAQVEAASAMARKYQV
jgi:tetratricopeptide (TPR) repeat protein/transcriptional regulator with XRE-family HTH domain